MIFERYLKRFLCLASLFVSLAAAAFGQSTTHTVQPGETLFKIAQQYDVEVQELRQWNELSSEELSVGQTLIVREPDPDNASTHIVEPGETLFSISKEYGVSIAELKSWNNLSTSSLNEGQKLLIYPSDTPQQQRQSIVPDNDSQDNDYYTVKSGDSLYEIAQQHDMTVDELQELNDLTSTTIRVGQRLTVRSQSSAPPSVAETVESSAQGKFAAYEIPDNSTSLDNILAKFQMDETEFRALNPEVNPANLRSGQTIVVLAPPTRTFENPYLAGGNLENLGTAPVSRYSNNARGSSTTNGELYNPEGLTAAHSNISLGSIIFIQNEQNQKGIYVRINDRSSGKGLKLSAMAWDMLQFRGSNPTVTIYQE